MPRVLSPLRRRRTDDSGVTYMPMPMPTPTQSFNYKKIITWVIALTVIVYSILFCGIQDTLRYLEFVIVLLGTVIITMATVLKSDV